MENTTKKYRVEIIKRTTYFKVYEIEAENALEAEQIAEDIAYNDDSMEHAGTDYEVMDSEQITEHL